MHCDCPNGYVGHNCEIRLLDALDAGNILSCFVSDICICLILKLFV